MTSVSMQQDPLLSGGALNASPMRPSSLNPTGVGGAGGGGGGGPMFTSGGAGSAGLKSESPTMMSVDQTPDDVS